MCHIGTWSTRYCMRTTEKVWGQKEKKIKTVCRVSALALSKGASLPSARTAETRQRILNFFKKTLLPSARPGGTLQRI